ncbi:MAG TPA: BadF/BadG/BcrA/BcrD ATPase family protein [Candidatus Dormibacteraeota bacterium]|nr:BadF/BadG/BcrA/BcrD ATPase family protein [Candidatus Dormibacteraeota bacterium]
MAYFLGVDGGGSKTTCAVGDEVSLLARVTTGPSNINRVGETRARESLHQAIRQACEAAGIDPRQVQCACVGVAGVGNEETARAVRKMVAEIMPAEIEVVGDMQIALEAAFGGGPGVIMIAGTGSIAYGRDAQGRTARAGGWGFAVSDEGSAHWIGRTAVANLLRAIDQEEKVAAGTPLFLELRAVWNFHSVDELVRSANSGADFAALFPVVLATADAGDAVAKRVLAQAAVELARLAGIVMHRLFDSGDTSRVSLAMVGGVFRHAKPVREAFQKETCMANRKAHLNPEVVEPVHGALQRAREAGRECLGEGNELK